MPDKPRLLFVTGRLAEFALRHVLDELAPRAGFHAEIAVLPISVAALMPPKWIARHLQVPADIDRVILPGFCRGDLSLVAEKAGGRPVELGPEDLRDLPRHFGTINAHLADYGAYDVEILAEINHAPDLRTADILSLASEFQAQGADVIDIGCNPGGGWNGVGPVVRALRDAGHRVSIDSFDPREASDAVAAGAELVLSVNSTNRAHAVNWGVEVVAIPDQVDEMTGLDETLEFLTKHNVPFRVDPVLEPIGFGFAASLGRYLETRRRYPQLPMMMGVGNLTELTDADSAGVNVVLLGFCQELKIHSVLTTQVINWARTAVRELDLARRLVRHAVTHRTLPKHVEARLVMLRDPRPSRFGADVLRTLARGVKDPNWRLYAEDGTLYAFNNELFLTGTDAFEVFQKMRIDDASHAFYLGYELAKAVTALTLDKNYRQDQALEWGFLTRPEATHRGGSNH
jgi:dihydropteroate synthase